MIYRTLLSQILGEEKEDYVVDDVNISEIRIHHVDLVFHAKYRGNIGGKKYYHVATCL